MLKFKRKFWCQRVKHVSALSVTWFILLSTFIILFCSVEIEDKQNFICIFFSDFSFGHTLKKIQISILSDSVYLQRCDTIGFHVPDYGSCHCHAWEVLRPCRSLSSECDIICLAVQLFTGNFDTTYQLTVVFVDDKGLELCNFTVSPCILIRWTLYSN